MSRGRTGLVVLAALVGCGGEETETETPGGCDALELALEDGSCVRPGVPPDRCAAGFAHDGEYGCTAVLPNVGCAPGMMAVPGEEQCRPVMACGDGRWGDIPVDGATVYVDGAYAGGQSDGSDARPWTTISEAVDAAAPGALVAVAAGTYMESVEVAFEPVRLAGVCPERVSIVATGQPNGGCPASGVCISIGAHGAEVSGVSISGPGVGIVLSGVENVVIDRVWVHDNALRGISATFDLGLTTVTVRRSLIEANSDVGIFVAGAQLSVEASVVRGTLPRSDQQSGRGINAQVSCEQTSMGVECDATKRSSIVISGSLIEQNRDVGLFVSGSDVTLDGTLVRATVPRASDQTGGRGMVVQRACNDSASGPVCDPVGFAGATVTGSVIERNEDIGINASGVTLSLRESVVRGTSVAGTGGRGVNVQPPCSATPTGPSCHMSSPSSVEIVASLVEQSQDIGVFVAGSTLTMDASVVRRTAARPVDGLFGDGVAVFADPPPASAAISRSLVAESARAGLASFGAGISLSTTRVLCAAFALSGDTYGGQAFAFDDGGDNQCGCPHADSRCKAVSAGLEPPSPLAQP